MQLLVLSRESADMKLANTNLGKSGNVLIVTLHGKSFKSETELFRKTRSLYLDFGKLSG
jgi:hypothetical protein